MSWLRNLLALLVGLVLTGAALVGVDRAYAAWTDAPASAVAFFSPASYDPVLGYAADPDTPAAHRKEIDGRVIFDVVYRLDEHRRRRTAADGDVPASTGRRFALFFGGSNTFGEGLHFEETIPAVFESLRPEYRAYNYAYRGFGPQQMLAKLEAGFAPDELGTAREGIAVFQYFDYQARRAGGHMSVIRWAGGMHPYYYVDGNGELRRDDVFATGRPIRTRLLWLLSKSAILTARHIDLPTRPRPADYELTCRILRASRERLAVAFPGSRFIAVIGLTTPPEDEFVKTCLVPHDFEHLDLHMPIHEARELMLEADNHLDPGGARYVAQQLADYLGGEAAASALH